MKKLLCLFSIFGLVLSEIVNTSQLIDIKEEKQFFTQNCLTTNENDDCTQCIDGYELDDNGLCQQVQEENDDFLPQVQKQDQDEQKNLFSQEDDQQHGSSDNVQTSQDQQQNKSQKQPQVDEGDQQISMKQDQNSQEQDDEIQSQQGQKQNSSEDFKDDEFEFEKQLQQNFLPCQDNQYCGQAKGFSNQKEFQQFTKKHAHKFRKIINNDIHWEQRQYDSMQIQNDFSQTNNQVTNIDEADLLKTDGSYIYTISNKFLVIILAYPVQRAEVVSKIDMGDQIASAIFIEDTYLCIFGSEFNQFKATTFIKIYNIENRAQPLLFKNIQVQGAYINARKTNDGFVYILTSQYIYQDMRPWYDLGVGKINIALSSILYYPQIIQPEITYIFSFNLQKPNSEQVNTICVIGQSSQIMYMSQRNIYLSTSKFENGRGYSLIRKIFVSKNNIRPFASGMVKGTINNQFSMDQFGPFLRVATTSNDIGTSSNNVFVLDFYLQPYGQLTGIAPGERIYSCRFLQRKLYLVTFRQIDPFFVINLNDHRTPQIVGELKIPGFSRYMHLYDEQTIIGFGRQADEGGRQKGLKLSLFDVSDVFSPQQIAKFQLNEQYSSSTAEWQHKAFLFSLSKNLLVIPATLSQSTTKFNGALAFFVDKDSKQIRLISAINHYNSSSDQFYQKNVQRSIYIEDMLYTKSKCLIKISNIQQQLEQVKQIKIPCDRSPPKFWGGSLRYEDKYPN